VPNIRVRIVLRRKRSSADSLGYLTPVAGRVLHVLGSLLQKARTGEPVETQKAGPESETCGAALSASPGHGIEFEDTMERKRLGELLRERQHITEQELVDAIHEQHENSATRLGEILLLRSGVDKSALVAALETLTRTKYIDCQNVSLDSEVVSLLSREMAEHYRALPLWIEDRRLHIAMAEPQNLAALDELRFATGMALRPCFGFRSEIAAGIAKAYKTVVVAAEDWLSSDEPIEFISTSSSESNKVAMQEFEEELKGAHTPAVLLVSNIIRAAVAKRASDIHIEQTASEAVVRIRVDGVLRELLRVPTDLRLQLLSRVKILADLDIAERRISQDGRFLANIGLKQLDLRVSTLPTQYGEKIVMRLLDGSSAMVPFETLGLSPRDAQHLSRLLSAPQGMILVTGPTGSGKSTTLYSAINCIKSPRVNITTIEDPVEYVIDGVNQVQVNSKAGRTFASCLRSVLRQDPNVLMVGEIRDAETAEIALTAAQTGHLVISTLHTNDSVSAITRLIDLNIAGFLIASSVTAVIAQRLVRKLCSCRTEQPVTREYAYEMRGVGFDDVGDTMFAATGCSACEGTGYSGRVGIYELLPLEEYLRSAIREGARDNEIRAMARTHGFEPMSEDSRKKIRTGLTTLEEVRRVVPLNNEAEIRCDTCEQTLYEKFRFCPECGTQVHTNVVRPVLPLPANM
jgi:type IV pilus assembly protein PilB